MKNNQIKSVLVVGGGSAGWMAAAALANMLREGVSIDLVESEEIGTVGVGEATIPALKKFNNQLGLNQREFVRATGASFKLGIDFVNWGRQGHRYFHPFGQIGFNFDLIPIEQYWFKLWLEGNAPPLDDLSMAWGAASRGRFASLPRRPAAGAPRRPNYDYAYHFDAGRYAAHLREYAEALGVTRHEGKIVDVKQDGKSGLVRSVKLTDGRELKADLFIDCSGFRSLLIEGAMKSKFEDWSNFLPCDRALAVPTERSPDGMTPYTRSTAHEAGWQWRIPLQHRTGNGHVFVSSLMSEDEAAKILLDHVDTPTLAEPRLLKFKAGFRDPWVGNVVALGLAAGFMEPLESTSIHLVQTSINRLLTLFPTRGFDPKTIAEFNRLTRFEWELIRDFLVLHYCANERTDSELWRHCATMELPPSLQEKIDYFRATGRMLVIPSELFQKSSWLAVFLGQFIEPTAYNPIADSRPSANAKARIEAIVNNIARTAEAMPLHEQFIERNCRSPLDVEKREERAEEEEPV
ncbi:MAG: tryptophan halogenase family protein [Sphingomicrobium sp.]